MSNSLLAFDSAVRACVDKEQKPSSAGFPRSTFAASQFLLPFWISPFWGSQVTARTAVEHKPRRHTRKNAKADQNFRRSSRGLIKTFRGHDLKDKSA
jgi:hypothetical protein